MQPILRGRAVKLDLVLEEGSVFEPVFHNLVDGARDKDGEHEPFEEYSVAYFTIEDDQGGNVLLQLGPEEEALDGTCVLDADAGIIEIHLAAPKSIGLAITGRNGWFNLVIYPGGDPDRAYRYAEGDLLYSRRGSDHPPEES